VFPKSEPGANWYLSGRTPLWKDNPMNHAATRPIWHSALQGRDIVIVSPQYWGDVWVSKHWIAFELSRRLRTVFVEPPVWVGGVLRHPWRERKDLVRVLKPVRRQGGQLNLLTPLLRPRLLGGAKGTWERVASTLGRMGIRAPVVINFGTNHELVKRLQGAVTVYYCVDPPITEAGHEHDEALTCEASDLIYSVSEIHRERLAAFCGQRPLHVIPHGYSFDHARRVAEDPAATCPPELRSLPRPIFGFVGSIHDAFVDVDRVERLAQARPDASIVLMGPYQNNPLGPDLSPESLRRLRQLPNVHLLGPRHFLEVPRYVKYFDVCLVLVNLKDHAESSQTGKRTHFKWLVYLSMGKPVVAPMVHDAGPVASLVYLAADEPEYLEALRKATAENASCQAPRIAYASQFAFDKTLDSVSLPIAELLRARSGTR